jgi:tetratricopeptide (TPR) repeat protein
MTDNDLTPQQQSAQGMAHFRSGNYEAAQRDFTMAAAGYTAAGDMLSAAEMGNNLSLVYLKLSKPELAWQAVAGTDAIFSAAGDTRRQALALGNQASVLEALKKPDQALAKYETCEELLKNIGDEENRVSVLEAKSQLQLRMGRQLEAMTSMQIALDHKPKLSLKERLLGKLLKIPARFFNR